MRWWLAAMLLLIVACGQAPTKPATQARHVFLIVMENHSYDQAMSGKFTASLAKQYGVAGNYHAITHPSLPNYLAITSGKTWGIRDDSYHVLPSGSDLGHNPFVFYGGKCPPNVVPLTELRGDLAGDTPRFVWITPDRCNDTHDCAV